VEQRDTHHFQQMQDLSLGAMTAAQRRQVEPFAAGYHGEHGVDFGVV